MHWKATAAPGTRTAFRAFAPTATSIPSAMPSSPGPVRPSLPPPRSSAIWGKSSPRMTSDRTSGIATGSLRRAGRAARISGRSRPPGRTPANRSVSPRVFCGCARATTGTRGVTRPSGTGWRRSRAASFTRKPGQRTWTTPASKSWSSVLAPPQPRSFRQLRPTAHMSRCCSARPRSSERAAMRLRSQMSCGRWISTRLGSTRSCAGRSCTSKTCSPADRSPNRRS